jgi:hypothetical protein
LPITGKLAGTFLISSQESSFSAQILQFCCLEQGLTGNLQLSTQVIQNLSVTSRTMMALSGTGNLTGNVQGIIAKKHPTFFGK